MFNVNYRNCGSAIHVALLVAYKEFDRVNRHKLLTKLEQRQELNYILKLLSSEHFAHLFSPLPSVSLFGVDRHDRIYPGFCVLCELSVELVFFHIITHSLRPPQSGPSSGSLPFHVHRCYFLCNILVVSSHYMAMPRNAFLGDIYDDGLTIKSLLNVSFLIPSFRILP